VVITKAVEANAKASVAVKWFGSGGKVEAGGGGSYAKAETHKVKLSLKPVAASTASVTPTPEPPSRPAGLLISDDE
jgi:hypothetical protein